MRINDLRAKRAKILTDAGALIDVDAPTAEAIASYDAMIAEANGVEAHIRRLEAQQQHDAELAVVRADVQQHTGRSADEQASGSEREKRLIRAWMGGSVDGLVDADHAAIRQRCSANPGFSVQAAAATTSGPGGGYTVAPDFQRELLVAQRAFGGMRSVARIMPTATGVNLPWPMVNDTNRVATIVGENGPGAPAPDLLFSTATLTAFTYRSGYLLVSIEMLQDSAFDFDALVRDALAESFARGMNAHFTNGNGTTQPLGVATGGVVGVTGKNGQTDTVKYDDLVDLQHSIDPAYRAGAAWMLNDRSIATLRKLKDASGRPLWNDSGSSIADMLSTSTLLGAPVVVNQDMPIMAAGAASIAFGQFKSYVIRDVLGLRLTRLNERFAENGQVGFLGFQRADGRPVSPVANIKFYQNSAA